MKESLGHSGPPWISSFEGQNLELNPSKRQRLSHDYFHYSPVLKASLQDKVADAILTPKTPDDLFLGVKTAVSLRLPMTPRGAGTGNYGQAVPLYGGLVLDLTKLQSILDTGDGYARVQTGVKLGVLEQVLRQNGQELRIYPSTYIKATVGGFVAGGSGGIGSITWGSLWDGAVLSMTILTAEAEPRWMTIKGQDLAHYIHAYGTTGLVCDVTLATAQKVDWHQWGVSFAQPGAAVEWGRELAMSVQSGLRLISIHEWPIPTFFSSLRGVPTGHSIALVEASEERESVVRRLLTKFNGTVFLHWDQNRYHRGLGVSEFTWNHTTLWAMKNDPRWTYLQVRYHTDHYPRQIEQLHRQFGDRVLQHMEWIRDGGQLVLSGLPLLYCQSPQEINEVVEFCHAIGVDVYDPHTYELYGEGRKRQLLEAMGQVKRRHDPFGLLNPGKLLDVREASGA